MFHTLDKFPILFAVRNQQLSFINGFIRFHECDIQRVTRHGSTPTPLHFASEILPAFPPSRVCYQRQFVSTVKRPGKRHNTERQLTIFQQCLKKLNSHSTAIREFLEFPITIFSPSLSFCIINADKAEHYSCHSSTATLFRCQENVSLPRNGYKYSCVH